MFPLRQPAGLVVFMLMAIQLGLGFVSWAFQLPDSRIETWHDASVMVRTGHQATGAMILAMVVVIAMRSFRLLSPPRGEGTSS